VDSFDYSCVRLSISPTNCGQVRCLGVNKYEIALVEFINHNVPNRYSNEMRLRERLDEKP